MKLIDGRALAEKIKDEVVREILGDDYFCKPQHEGCDCCGHDGHNHDHEDEKKAALRKSSAILACKRPNLAVVLVGDREDSKTYVSLKEAEAKKVGIDTHIYRCPENILEQEVLDIINYLNKDESVDAVLIQLPLPTGLDTDKIVKALDPAKDVDGFHPDNLKILLSTCDHSNLIPPVFDVVLEMLKSIKYDLKDKQVCILANSDIFGKSLAKVLECKGANVEVVGAEDKNLAEKTRKGDVLISAIGRPKFIKKEMIKQDAVVIDIGTTKEGAKVYGDVDFEDVKEKVGYITPVPGGVGPMTIAMTFKNTLKLFKKRKK